MTDQTETDNLGNVVSIEKPRIDRLEQHVTKLQEQVAEVAVLLVELTQHYATFVNEIKQRQKIEEMLDKEIDKILEEYYNTHKQD